MSRIWDRVVHVAAWCAVHAYYRSVRVEGRERLPATGPVLLVCNHPNSLLDPAVLLVVARRPVRFAVKAPLFRVPVLGMILRGIGAVPIERPDDAGADVRRNVGALAGLAAALRNGAACGFFPEGFTHTDPRLHAVRSGPARIAVDAEASANGALGLRVVPVGLSFHPQQAFRGEVVVRVGEPFGVADLCGTNRHVAVRTVQERIAAGLRPVVHHVGRAELAALVERVATLHVERASAGRLTAPRETDVHVLGAALDVCSVADPVAVDALDALTDRHDRLSGRTGVEGAAVGLSTRPARALTLFLCTALGLVAGFPLFLAGLLTGYVPYRLTASTAGRAARREGAAAVPFLRVVLGAWWFGLYWGLLAWLVFAWSESAGVTAVFVASMAATGLFALGYASRAVRWEKRLEALAPFAFRRRVVARVAEARDAVVAAATEIVERHGPDGGAAAWRAEREGPPVRQRVPWLRVGAIAAAGASAWFLAGFRGTAMEEMPDVASPWAAVPPAAAGPMLERDAVSLAACLDALESLDTRMRA
ncbi:MAG: 1-acyl-sn-glycerol-3-phosphate acyltransferase, partial [Planctomycetes bacterium]|nr:1-acyl-sn-glycerol-3-phosphate acyltransferase [Planctomycetota bacterium]